MAGLWDTRPAPEGKVERQGISHMSVMSVCGSGAKGKSTGGRWPHPNVEWAAGCQAEHLLKTDSQIREKH